MKIRRQRFDCKNENDELLFYIELDWNWGLEVLCSIPSTVTHNTNVLRTIRCIQEPLVKYDLKIQFIHELMNYIKQIPDIEKYYFN